MCIRDRLTPARGSLRAIHTPASSMGKRWLPPWKWSWERMEPPTMGKSALEDVYKRQFPTHVKLSPPKDKPIDTVILNGAECEPFLSADHRVMLEEADAVLDLSLIHI